LATPHEDTQKLPFPSPSVNAHHSLIDEE